MFYENRLGIKKIVISFVYVFCPNIGTKFREPYHSNHVIPHRVKYSRKKLRNDLVAHLAEPTIYPRSLTVSDSGCEKQDSIHDFRALFGQKHI